MAVAAATVEAVVPVEAADSAGLADAVGLDIPLTVEVA